ncbi:hypothetical protein V5E97_32345 [Singulisphaera sp. Ch08]|uniref:Carboxypeptidase regulatory-like domain-containing protein n=1 Tax=Singulisphaera sp. Ch08 TaxID=3120278 RepID=A0AAU7CD72_9BACT
MRPIIGWYTMTRLTLVSALVVLGEADLLACSGPGAGKVIRESELIGNSLAGIATAIFAGGYWLMRRRSLGHRICWVMAPMVLHPRLWMDAVHGDCGYGLRYWSVVGTLGIAIAVLLATCWPRPAGAGSKPWQWTLSGVLAGAFPGLLVAALIVDDLGSLSATNLLLTSSALFSPVIAGGLVGRYLFRRQAGEEPRFRFSTRSLVLLPFVLAPLFATLLPVRPYQAMVSTTSPFSFVVVDEATGRPIPDAVVQVIDPSFALDDTENQSKQAVTGADGHVNYHLYANVHGREGLLGQTETISYNPMMIQVKALGYLPYFTSLASDPPLPADRLTAPPLGLTFPPPRSVMILLKPDTRGVSMEEEAGHLPLAP